MMGKWESRRATGAGRGHRREAVLQGPAWAGAGKKEETKNKRRKTKGQWSQLPLTLASLNFGVAVVTASKGQGGRERVGPELPGQEKPSWMLP